MRYFVACVFLLIFSCSQAQQINPVPDYVFRNQMSVGRNAPTDTAAYFSVGPRFGATKGMMPPMVVDTASFSGSKRNGLLIFSVQKNKYLYWDSVRVQWSDMAGSSGQYITGTVTATKIPKATSATVITDSRMSESGLLISAPRFKADSMLFLPKMSTTPTDTGAVRYSLTDSTAYLWTGYQWIKTGISKQDTATMLSPYLRSSDTSAMLTSYLRKVDTASMLTPYLRKVDTSAMLTSYLRKIDTASMLTPYLRKIDTLTMLSPYVRSAGYGLTKSGQSLLVDTAAMATRARVQKAVDSLGVAKQNVLTNPVTGTGASGQVAYWTGTTSQSGENALFWDATNDRLGIGTSSPSTEFHIKSSDGYAELRLAGLTGSGASLEYYSNTTQLADIYADASANLIFRNNPSTERMRITAGGELLVNTTSDAGAYALQVAGSIYNTTGAVLAASSGSVGIGTASPATSFEVFKSTASTITIRQGTNAGDRAVQLTANGNGAVIEALAGNLSNYSGDMRFRADGGFVFYVGPSSGTGSSDYRALSITSSKKIFFGNSIYDSPITAEIGAPESSVVSDNNGSNLNISGGRSTGTGTGGYVSISTSPQGGVSGSSYNSLVERLRVTAAGEMLINTSSDAGAYALQVSGSIYNTTGAVFSASSGEVLIGGTSDYGNYVAQIQGNLYNTTGAVIAGNSGGLAVGVGTLYGKMAIYDNGTASMSITNSAAEVNGNVAEISLNPTDAFYNSGFYNKGSVIKGILIDGATNQTALSFSTYNGSSNLEGMRVTSSQEVLIGTTTDAGAYALQVAGSIYNTTGAVLAASSGNVGIGTSPSSKLHVKGGNGSAINSDNAGEQYSGYDISNNGTRKAFFQYNNTAGAVYVGADVTDMDFYTNGAGRLRITSAGEFLLGSSIPSDAGTYALQVLGNIYNTGTITTGTPSGGSNKPWKIGEAATVSPTSPNRTIRVEIDGTVYYIHAKTTND